MTRRYSFGLGTVALMVMASLGASGSSALKTNPGTVTINDPSIYSRVVAVSDAHGMLSALLTLLNENGLTNSQTSWIGGKSLLVVVGDSIDKGPQSIEIIDLWIKLALEAEAAGGRVLVLLGNHEAEFLANPTSDNAKAAELLAELQARGIPIEQLTDPKYPRGKFLRSLPLAARIGKWLFCHAGFYPDMSWSQFDAKATEALNRGNYSDPFLTGSDSILEAKQWWKYESATRADLLGRLRQNDFAGVVFGHQPKALNAAGRIAISEEGWLIKIDNGMAPEGGAHPGSLLLFDNPRELSGTARPHSMALVRGRPQTIMTESRLE